jgi:hypothetical protein
MGTLFYLSTALLAAMLFLPVSRLIWVLAVRRRTRKAGRELTQEELGSQKNLARLAALILVLLFSWLFNLQLHARLYG